MAGIKAVISDFGGVLTSPLMNFFAAFQDSSGVSLETLGKAMARIAEQEGFQPLFELEKGVLSEQRFVELLDGAVSEELGRPVHLHGLADAYWTGLDTNEEMVEYLRGVRRRGYRLPPLTHKLPEGGAPRRAEGPRRRA